jgi:hypothetical protein
MLRSQWWVFLVLFLPVPALAAEPFRYAEGKHGQGELKYINGVPVLNVAGTPEEIGAQIGVLTAKPLQRLVHFPRALMNTVGLGWLTPQVVKLSNAFLPHFPPDYRQELASIAQHSHVDMDLAVLGNTLFDILKVAGCSTLIVEPGRSATKAPLFGRNLDYPTMGFLHHYSLVTVYRPKGKHAFVSVGFPGMVGCLSGMNDAGLAVATLEVYEARDKSPRLDFKGTPYALCFRRLLEECTTVEEAERLLRSMKRTTMNNLAVCDQDGGVVFEITSTHVVVRRPVDDICACTNHFRTPELATATPKELASPRNCARFLVLEKARQMPLLDLAAVASKLHGTNQGELTLQTMIFEPAGLKLHVAFGQTPSSALPLKTLELAPLFKR